MDGLSAAASIIAVIQLAGQVTSVTYGYISEVKGASKAIGQLLAELGSLSSVLLLLQDYADRTREPVALQQLNGTNGVGGPLRECAEDLNELYLKLNHTKLIDKLKWPLREKDVMKQVERLERYKTLFNFALTADQASLSEAIARYTKNTDIIVRSLHTDFRSEATAQSLHREKEETRQLVEKRRKVLGWIYPGSFDRKHNEICKRRQKDTGGWLLKKPEFGEWAEGLCRLLWGYGIPGAGKTFISSLAVEYLQSQAKSKNYGVAYIYFDYKEQDRQRPTDVLASLVKQLSVQASELHLPAAINRLYDTLEPESKEPSLQELYDALVTISESFAQVFMVFDALDECHPDNQRKELLPLIHRMAQGGINLFLTSRQYPIDIQESLSDVSKIEIIAQQEDLEIYITKKIDDNTRIRNLVRKTKRRERIISELIECSKGMFLLVHFHVEFLCQQTTARQMLAALDRLKAPRTGETSVYPTYDRVMDTIRRQESSVADLALRVLSWLVKARRTLTVRELQTAVSVEPGIYELDDDLDLPDGLTLLDVCSGLVTIDENSKTIQLAHYTVQEYLEKKNIIPENADFELAMSCITFLSFDAFTGGACPTLDSYKARIDSYPFLKYAAHHLESHMKACDEDLTTGIVLKLAENPGSILSYRQVTQDLFDIRPADFARIFTELQGFTENIPLHQLAEWGHLLAVKLLLDKDSNSALARHGSSALRIAVRKGNLAICQLLVEKGVDISIADERGWTVLHDAVHKRKEAVVNLLVEKGADLSVQDNRGETPLYRAVSSRQDAMAQLMLQQEVDDPDSSRSGKSLLVEAAARGNHKVVQLLLDTGVGVPTQNKNSGDYASCNALHTAILGRHSDLAILLLERGIDYSVPNLNGETALFLAARTGNEAVVRLLLEKGADHSVPSSDGWTPLNSAADEGHEAVVQLLLEKGADHSVPTSDGWTPLNSAAKRGHEAVVQLLLEKGADHSVPTSDGWTPLNSAAKRGHEAVVQLLLEKGADHSVPSGDGWTSLNSAANNGHEAVVQLLLEKGTDHSVPNNGGETPLNSAAAKGHEEVVQLLLANEAGVSAADINGNTPLHNATSDGNPVVVKLLLAYEASCLVTNKSGQTAQDIAIKEKDDMLIRLFEDTLRKESVTG